MPKKQKKQKVYKYERQQIYIPSPMHKKIKEIARQEGSKLYSLIVRILQEWIDKREKK
jgi:hypothetical protein